MAVELSLALLYCPSRKKGWIEGRGESRRKIVGRATLGRVASRYVSASFSCA